LTRPLYRRRFYGVALGDHIRASPLTRRFNDATSEENAANCHGARSDLGIAATPRTTRRAKV
jgi:hypothetical protein